MATLTLSIFQALARSQTPEAKLNWLDMAADRAAKGGSQVLVCPELYLSGYHAGDRLRERSQRHDGGYARQVGDIALMHQIAIAYTYPEYHASSLYNAVGFVGADGQLIGHHRKNVLNGDYEARHFTADHGIRLFDYAGWRIGMLVGHDIEYPEAARQAALAGAELLIVPAALTAERGFIGDKMVPVRAFENGLYLACANWAGTEGGTAWLGGSRIIAPDGSDEVIAGGREEIVTAVLQKPRIAAAREALPYLARCGSLNAD